MPFKLLLLVLLLLAGSVCCTEQEEEEHMHVQVHVQDEYNDDDEGECSIDDGVCQSGTRTNYNKNLQEQQQNQCGLYMAESSIPNSGLGMFLGIDSMDGEQVFYGDMVIHIEDLTTNNLLRQQYMIQEGMDDDDDDDSINRRPPLLESYIWHPLTTLGDYEADDVRSIIPGLGMLANSHQGLWNIFMQYQKPTISYLLNRSTSPGSGSVTNYHNFHYLVHVNQYDDSTTNTSAVLPAGTELFGNYGDAWFTNRTNTLGLLPLSTDFENADQLLIQFLHTVQINKNTTTTTGQTGQVDDDDDDEKASTVTISTNDTLLSDLYELFINTSAKLRPQLRTVLPNNIFDVYKAFQNVGLDIDTVIQENELFKEKRKRKQETKLHNINNFNEEKDSKQEDDSVDDDRMPDRRITASWSVPDRIKSIDWLNNNGRCLDNIRPNISSIHHAGMGAYTTRYIQQGQIIAPMPLIHLTRSQLELYNVHESNGTIYKEGQQQLLNYVYGHAHSTMLLLPYSPIVNYINHHSNSSMINAKLQWSTLPTKYNRYQQWKDRTVQEIVSNEDYCGLVLEVVATRDIEPNEELFLNYGTEWDKAWQQHEQQWYPLQGSEHYVPASVLNEQNKDILTQDELLEMKYQNLPLPYSSISDDLAPVFIMISNDRDRYPCDVIERSVDGLEYTVIVTFQQGGDSSTNDTEQLVQGVVEFVPRSALTFVDKRYKSDMSIRTAFRHEIHIPDDIFPQQWKDLLL